MDQCPNRGYVSAPDKLDRSKESDCTLHCPITLTLDSGVVSEVCCNVTIDGNDQYFSLKSPVEWNGWRFETGEGWLRNSTVVRFSLYAREGVWRQVGSSTLMQVADATIYLDGEQVLPSSHIFRTLPLEGPRPYSFLLARTYGGVFIFAIAFFAAMGRVRLAALMPAAFSYSFILHNLYETLRTPPYHGDRTFLPSAAMVFTETGALFFSQRNQYVYLFMWYGACWIGFGSAIYPYGPEGRSCAIFLAGIGAPFLLAGAAVKVSQIRNRAASCRAIEEDRRIYDAIWAELLADPASRRALDAIAAEAAAAGAPAASSAPLQQQQAETRRAEGLGRAARLLRREEGWILADLARLYAAAAAADAPLRAAVLRVARGSGGLLPAADRGGEEYVRVTEWTAMEDVAWAPLKGQARALEKASGRPCRGGWRRREGGGWSLMRGRKKGGVGGLWRDGGSMSLWPTDGGCSDSDCCPRRPQRLRLGRPLPCPACLARP